MQSSRVLAIAQNAFRETIRDRVLFLIAFFVLLLVAGISLLPYLAAGEGNKLVSDLGLALIHLMSLVIAVFVGTSLVSKEIEKRTIFTLIAKPVNRVEFLVGKHFGLAAVLAVLMTAMTASFAVVYFIGVYREVPLPWGNILLAIGFSYLELWIIIAAALFFGSFTSAILAALLTFALYLAGHFSSSLLQLGVLSKNETVMQITRFAYLILPDLERFNLRNSAVYGQTPPWADLGGTVLYGLLYTLILLTGAYLVFRKREF